MNHIHCPDDLPLPYSEPDPDLLPPRIDPRLLPGRDAYAHLALTEEQLNVLVPCGEQLVPLINFRVRQAS